LYWAFPPSHLENRTIKILIEFNIPAIMVVTWNNPNPHWLGYAAKYVSIYEFSNYFDRDIFLLHGQKIRSNKNYSLLVTRWALDLNRINSRSIGMVKVN